MLESEQRIIIVDLHHKLSLEQVRQVLGIQSKEDYIQENLDVLRNNRKMMPWLFHGSLPANEIANQEKLDQAILERSAQVIHCAHEGDCWIYRNGNLRGEEILSKAEQTSKYMASDQWKLAGFPVICTMYDPSLFLMHVYMDGKAYTSHAVGKQAAFSLRMACANPHKLKLCVKQEKLQHVRPFCHALSPAHANELFEMLFLK